MIMTEHVSEVLGWTCFPTLLGPVAISSTVYTLLAKSQREKGMAELLPR